MPTTIGVPKEIKDKEGRVSMQPDGASELVHHGHEVIVESGAGRGAGFSDEEYERAGARMASSAKEVFDASELIVKVKFSTGSSALSASPISTPYRPAGAAE